MSDVPVETVREACLTLMKEAFPGGDPGEVWFTDGGPESGLFGALDSVDAKQASTPAREGGPTVAQIAAHVRFLLQFGNALFQNQQPRGTWEGSWSVHEVDEEEWLQLRAEIRSEYQNAITLIERFPAWQNRMALTGAFGQIAHAAYHLGAIRQIIRQLEAQS